MQYKAFLFDLNGTMVDDMKYHIEAWHKIFHKLGADISLDRTTRECYGKNGELLERIFPNRFSEEEKYEIGMEKEMQYRLHFKPRLKLIDGLYDFLHRWHAKGIRMAIGSAAIQSNIDFVLDGLSIRNYFDVLVSADTVRNSKPDPETFIKCANQLGIPPSDCLVFEDSPKGVECAHNGGMDSFVITTLHGPEDFKKWPGVIGFADDYRSLDFDRMPKLA